MEKTLNAHAQTPLVSAVIGGRAEVTRRTLQVPAQTPGGTYGAMNATLLHTAAFGGIVDVIEVLLTAGADIDARSDNGMTPLRIATAKGHPGSAEMLIARGAEADLELAGGLLLGCCTQRKYSVLEAVVRQQSISIDEYVFGKCTWLYVAIYTLPASIVRALLERGVDTDAASTLGCGRYQHPLQFAVELREPAYVQALLEIGADQSLRDHLGRTAIDFAEPSDKAFALLSTTHLTPPRIVIANADAFVKGLCEELSAAIVSGATKNDENVRYQLEVIGLTLLCIAGRKESAQTWFEQCITWKEAEDESGRMMQHTLDCNGCRELSGIMGVMHVCGECDGDLARPKVYQQTFVSSRAWD